MEVFLHVDYDGVKLDPDEQDDFRFAIEDEEIGTKLTVSVEDYYGLLRQCLLTILSRGC